jgi:dienelactone hydrolase
MGTAFVFLFGALLLADLRNTYLPGTDTHLPLPAPADRTAWEARKLQLRRQILASTGLYPVPARTPLRPQVFGRIENRDAVIEKVLIETMPGYYLGGNLFHPREAKGKLPAVLVAHGHWQYGRLENQPIFSGPALALNLARQGYVVFAYDMVGYNDTVQTPHQFSSPAEQLWSFGPLQLQLWNGMRALDFLASLPEVDTARVAMTGASGGATQTLLLTAVDDRIHFAAPVNMVSAIMQGGDTCENAPGLRVATTSVEMAAMFAPKPMILVSATGDWTRNNPTEEIPAIRKIFELYDRAANLENLHLDAPHNYNRENREAVYRFFGKHILGESDEKKFAEKNPQVEMLQNMLALAGRSLPANALTYPQVFEEWKKTTRPAQPTRDILAATLHAQWPEKVLTEGAGQKLLLSRAGAGDQIPASWTAGQGEPLLVLGAAPKSDRPTLAIDVFQTGAAVAPRDRSARHFLAFNLSDDQCRVQDVLTALAFLRQKTQRQIEIVAPGRAQLWAQAAAALAPVPVKVRPDPSFTFGGTDEDYLRDFNVPGIRRAGGMEAVRSLLTSSSSQTPARPL